MRPLFLGQSPPWQQFALTYFLYKATKRAFNLKHLQNSRSSKAICQPTSVVTVCLYVKHLDVRMELCGLAFIKCSYELWYKTIIKRSPIKNLIKCLKLEALRSTFLAFLRDWERQKRRGDEWQYHHCKLLLNLQSQAGSWITRFASLWATYRPTLFICAV